MYKENIEALLYVFVGLMVFIVVVVRVYNIVVFKSLQCKLTCYKVQNKEKRENT